MKLYVEDDVGDAVWLKATLPRPPEIYTPGLSVDAVVQGRPRNVTLPSEEMYQQEGLDMANCDDLCDLAHVHEASILDTIQERAHVAKPYTAAGDVVVAVNPFKWLKLYTPELRALHSAPPNSAEGRRAAHCYSVSGAAARGAARGDDQSILVSGESGSGKTETVKIMLVHLADVARHGGATSQIITQVLRAGPLLESFGNAATLRNGNSSRFAKFLRIEFDARTMALESSWCETALLEKTRVVERAKGERAFHVFYELLEQRRRRRPNYLPEHPCRSADASATKARGFDDRQSYPKMIESLETVCQLDGEAREALLHCVDAVLSLGEVSFDTVYARTEDHGCKVSNANDLTQAANALGCDRALLEEGFLRRTVGTSTTSLSADQAMDARDALAKELYSRLFDRVVELSNATTRRKDRVADSVVIGMLDLFGFEFYGAAGSTNGFEQLLINFANERLQQRFVADVLARAQRELLAEGVPWTRVDYQDNAQVLRLIEARGGLVDILNEECIRGGSGADANFVGKLLRTYKENEILSTPKIRMTDSGEALPFKINHYAGDVLYRCTATASWVERNRDVLPAKLVEAMTTPAGAGMSVAVFGAAEARQLAAQRKHRRQSGQRALRRGSQVNAAETVASKFRNQLKELMGQIAATKCRYVRCIRPNDNALPMGQAGSFDRVAVVEQLRCCGVLSALRVARAGYPDRNPLRAFVERFAVCLPGDGRSKTLSTCRAAADAAGMGDFDASLDGLAVTDDVDAPTAQDLEQNDEDLVLDRAVVAAALPWRSACEHILRCLEKGARKGALAKHPPLKPGRVFVGKTKVFLRDGALDDIERVRALVCFDLAARLQAHGRGYLGKKSYRKVLRGILIVACALRVKLARRRAAKRRRLVTALSCFQARWRGVDVRLVGCLPEARKAALAIQTKIGRPEVARRRCILVRDLRARGENLDSITQRLNRIALEKAGGNSPPRQQGSSVARAASMGVPRNSSGGSISGAEAEQVRSEANAMRELAGEASSALEEIRAENAELREKARLLALDVEIARQEAQHARQREQVLAKVVEDARREATRAQDAMGRHMSDAAALAGAGEANEAYARFRRKLLRHSDSMTPAMRSKLLEQKRPTAKVTITRAELARFVSDCQGRGLEVVKHNRKGKAQERRLKLTPDSTALYWQMRSGKPASTRERFYLEKCLELRAGHDVDPEARDRLVCGTDTLRKSLAARHCKLAFSFIFADRTVDVSFATVEDCKKSLRFFKAHVQDLKNKADTKVLLKDEAHIAATPAKAGGY